MFPFTDPERKRFLSLAKKVGEDTLINDCIGRGDLEGLKWLREMGTSLMYYIHNAVVCDQVEIVKWFVENQIHLTPPTCTAIYTAVAYDRLEIIKFLRSKDFPWDEESFVGAVWNNHLELLGWMVENGCPVASSDRIALASVRSTPEMLAYLKEHNFL